ncbi:unnamed protein product [Amoebophrya sp. A25]|nr:unnamed protein product [Amoebophrya sp. A25]|eukprot:GSA25T00017967001.1
MSRSSAPHAAGPRDVVSSFGGGATTILDHATAAASSSSSSSAPRTVLPSATSASSTSTTSSNTNTSNASTSTTIPASSSTSRRTRLSPTSSRSVLCLYTGGTIGMRKDADTGVNHPVAHYFPAMLKRLPMLNDPECETKRTYTGPEQVEHPEHQHHERTSQDLVTHLVSPEVLVGARMQVTIVEYPKLLDSSNMTHHDWLRMAKDVARNYDNFDGFCIVHGTDTMAYSASALSFFFENLSKPVVFTGSQIPMEQLRNDGLMNLCGALQLAAFSEIPEVTLYFDSKLYRGCRVTKIDSTNLHAFDSPNSFLRKRLRDKTSSKNRPPLCIAGIHYRFSKGIRGSPRNQSGRSRAITGPPPRTSPFSSSPSTSFSMRLLAHFEHRISIIRIFPGIFTTTRETLMGLRGLVLQTFGEGNAPSDQGYFLDSLKEAIDRGCVVVNVSQCLRTQAPSKGLAAPIEPDEQEPLVSQSASYATGAALESIGVVSGGDMTPEAALVKLGWLLGSSRLTPRQVRSWFQRDLRGETSSSSHYLQGQFGQHSPRRSRL